MRVEQWLSQCPLVLAFLVATLALGLSGDLRAEPPDGVDACKGCHGENGQSDDPDIPIIAGPSAFYLENQLFLFQQNNRPCAKEQFSAHTPAPPVDNHCALVADLSEESIMELAAYYADQPHKAADQTIDQALANTGQAIHERSCSRCHTDNGSLPLDDAGILAGQWRPYLIRTLTSFREGDRWQEEKMAEEVKKLSDEDIRALAEFYASQGL